MWIHMNPMFHVTTFTIPVPVFNVQYVIELSSQEHPSESDNIYIVRGAWQQHEHISQHNGEVLHEEGILGGGGNKWENQWHLIREILFEKKHLRRV